MGMWHTSWYNNSTWTFQSAGTYYWRILAGTDAGWGSLSSVRSFTVGGIPTYAVTGVVTAASGGGIGGVTISSGGRSTITDTSGGYTLDGLTAGTYTLTPTKPGYTFAPASRTVTMPPAATGQNFTGIRLYSMSGWAGDVNGNPLSGVIINASGIGSTTTAGDGTFAFGNVPAGTYSVTPSKGGLAFSPPARTVTLGPDASGLRFSTVAPGTPVVRSVRQCILGPYFMKGQWLPSRFDAEIDWQGKTPGYVNFVLNDVAIRATLSGNTASHVYNLGADLRYGLLPAVNKIKVIAVTGDNLQSAPYLVSNIYGFIPTGLLPGPYTVLNPGCVQGVAKYQGGLTFPEPAWEGSVTPPSWFPYIGGEKFGLKRTQASYKHETATDGTGKGEASGETGFDALGQALTGAIKGSASTAVTAESGMNVTDAAIGLEVSGELKKKVGVVDLIPALKAAENWWGVGDVIKWFNKRAQVEGKVEPSVEAKVTFASTPAGWRWKGLEGGAGARLTLALIIDLIKNGLTATAYGGGEPTITLQVPPAPSLLKEITAKLFAGIKVQIWKFETSFEAAYEWAYSPGGALELGAPIWTNPDGGQSWSIVPRSYAAEGAASYSVFHANEPRAGTSAAGSQATGRTTIASNIYPYAAPAIAVAGSQTLLLWTHDDVSRPQMQGEEIVYTINSGSTWSAPAGITADNLEDFAPQVAFDGFGHAVAVWERNKQVQTTASQLDAAYAGAFEIAFAVWDGESWSAPAYLTSNAMLDHDPVLSAGHNGKIMLAWRQNASGQLAGSAAAPDTIFVATWDGTQWSAGQPTVVTDDAGLSLAYYDDTQAVQVYARDLDGNPATDADQELYAVTWDGLAWSTPARLTNDSQADSSPHVLYDANGQVHVFWLKDQSLLYLAGSLTGEGHTVLTEGAAGLLDYQIARDPSSNIVVLWQALSPEGADLYYSVLDGASDSFSAPARLTADAAAAHMIAPALTASRQLRVAFASTQFVTSTVTISPTLTISNVVTFGQTDLDLLDHSLGTDLFVTAKGLALQPANPAPGASATISATVTNLGDLAVTGASIAFYRGDPASGGALITQRTVDLAGNSRGIVSVPWVVPSNAGPERVYLVADLDNSITEWNESNNQASVPAVTADLVVDQAWAGYGSGNTITLGAFIANTGVVAAPSLDVSFRLDDPVAGTELGRTTVPGLAPGAKAQPQLTWTAAGAPPGRHTVYAIADPTGAVVEASKTNNVAATSLALLPDLLIRPSNIVATFTATGTILAVTVHNEGTTGATGAVLGLYRGFPDGAEVPLGQTTMDVPAGTSRTASLAITQDWWPGLYVAVNPLGLVPERDLSNNVALFGQESSRLYLPMIAGH